MSKKLNSLILSRTTLLALVAGFLLLTANFTFFRSVLATYPINHGNTLFIGSVAVVLFCLTLFLMTLFSFALPTRVVATFFIFIAAFASYFADQYGSIIDTVMLHNALATDTGEAADLLSWAFFQRIALFAVLPLVFVWQVPLRPLALKRELAIKTATAGTSLALITGCLLAFSGQYANFFREHKPLRFYAIPAYPVYSLGKLIADASDALRPSEEFVKIATDAFIPKNHEGRELIVMVVGETARADRFYLNGYHRNTNPQLSKERNLVSYKNVTSCGTSTAISVPCMFAIGGRDNFKRSDADNSENALDVLARAGVSVLWRDNNSDSKGVATRVAYEDFKTSKTNPVCDEECRDVGMLFGLQSYIDKQPGDVLIVLHQMGNHGPAYFKRYPPEFEKFKPACHSIELSECTVAEISNAYDNAILYTDYFLSEVIGLLKKNSPEFETAMLYVSDHGESLGEKGLYLHGMPYTIAPKEQTHVPVILWVGSPTGGIELASAEDQEFSETSHDAVFPSLLQGFEVQSSVLKGSRAFFAGAPVNASVR